MRHLLSLVTGSLLMLSACGGSSAGDGMNGGNGPHTQGQSGGAASYTVELSYQHSQTISKEMVGLTLTAIEDSRCRVGQTCVTAGDIRLGISVSLPGVAPERRELQLSSADKQGVQVREYTLSLVRVDPTPAPQNVALSRYLVTVQLDKPASGS